MEYKQRYLQHYLDRQPANFRALLITGPRRSGKSTLSKMLLEKWGGSTYIPFDTPSEQNRFSADPEGFLRSLRLPVVLDEVQNVPQIFNYLKKIIDEKPSAGCDYILTGSQQFQMMRHVSESLAGRILIKELLPFSCSEARGVQADKIRNNFQSLLELKDIFSLPEGALSKDEITEVISYGGFPPIQVMSRESERLDWFNSYVETYIQRDIRSLSNLHDLTQFSRFVSLVAGRTGQIINYSELGKDIGVNYKTAQHYLSLLSTSYLWKSIPPYFKAGSEKRLSKSPKGYFLDTGLTMFLTGLRLEGLEKNPLLGQLFESFVFSEFLKLSFAFGERVTPMHFRIGEKVEVDLVLEVGQRLVPIEIKFSGTLDRSWGRGIQVFKEVAGLPKESTGYVISTHPQVMPIGNGVINLPIQAFL